MPKKTTRIPRYKHSHPPNLATIAELSAGGLKPGSSGPVALFEYQRGNTFGTCGLFERAAAVPVKASDDRRA